MKRFLRSTFVLFAMALTLATSGTAAHAAAPEDADGGVGAPDCVRFSAGWRYTFVTNDCSSTHSLTVVYRDGTDVPCRLAPPGALITFPGHGTLGNEVLGVALCDAGGNG
ncbi:alpha-amylase [Streptomyces lancefieldiae]|uniref:Alpha-amylase inhibitor n=1 Tax=Streptomyces lancefieldiae TaxID=3075520 RepID=A0ABU3AQI0_9ACTN|nr:alpha-amylase [Streptomyces sp. DSM 40712]MDT0611116.1 alpha-amylase [Streptomyces sp. DSM 40712]